MEHQLKWIINDLTEDAFSASSLWNRNYQPKYGKVNFTGGKGSWASKLNDVHQWLQVDLGKPEIICAVAIQGRHEATEWVTLYNLLVSENLKDWTTYEEIKGSSDQNVVVEFHLHEPAIGRYVRFVPQEWHKHISMRVDVGVELKSEKNISQSKHTEYSEPKKSTSDGIVYSQIQKKIEKFDRKEFDLIYRVSNFRNFDLEDWGNKIVDESVYRGTYIVFSYQN
ncbi:MAG: discoidin domain-containing protein [Bacteroidota bacterium]|jgi:hypothetical protein